MEAFRSFFVSVCETGPIILWFEDLQYADSWTVELLRILAANIHRVSMCLLCEIRRSATSGPGNDDVASITDVGRNRNVESIYLESLSIDGTRTIADRWTGSHIDDQTAEYLQRMTGGNRLYLAQFLRSSAGSDAAEPDVKKATLPVGIRLLVAARLKELTVISYRVLCTAALLGHDFDVTELCAPQMCWEDEAAPLAEIDQLASRGLVETGGRQGRYRFVHDLVREAVIADMPLQISRELHGRIADALEAIHGDDLESFAQTTFRHLQASGTRDTDRLASLAYRAGLNAFHTYAHTEAFRLLSEGLSILRANGDERLRADMHKGLAMVSSQAEEMTDWAAAGLRHFLEALRIYVRLGERETLRSFIREPGIIRVIFYYGMIDDVEPFEELVKMLPQDPRAELYRGHAVLTATNDLVLARSICNRARTLALEHADPHTELHACLKLGFDYCQNGDFEDAFVPTQRALELSRRLGDIIGEEDARRRLVRCLLKTHKTEAAKTTRREYVRWARATRNPEILARALGSGAMEEAMQEANWEKVRSVVAEFDSVAHATDNALRSYMTRIVPARLAVFTGNETGIARFIEFVASRGEDTDRHSHNLIRIFIDLTLLTGRAEYTDHLESVSTTCLEHATRRNMLLLMWNGYAGRGIVCALRGNRDEAQKYQLLINAEKAGSGWLRTGAISNLIGDYEDAIVRLVKATEDDSTDKADVLLSRILLADSMLSIANPDLLDGGIAEFRNAISTASANGMPLFAHLADRLAHRHGIDLSVPTSDKKNSFALTDREIEVLRLVAEGMLNKEIASALNISVRTVHRHVEKVLRKTGCGNRTEAAKFAVTHGLV